MTIEQIMSIQLHFKQRANMRSLYPSTMPLWSIIQGAQENQRLKATTEEARKLKNTDSKAYNKFKAANFVAVYFGAKFGENDKPDLPSVTGYTGLAGFDFDDIKQPLELIEDLKLIPEIVCASVSVSGTGVWCVARVAVGTAGEYMRAYARGIQTFMDNGLIGMDLGCHDPTRARFISYCPDAWWRWDANGDIPAFVPDGDTTVLRSPTSKYHIYMILPESYKMSPEVAHDAMLRLFAENMNVPDGEMNNAKARMAGKLKGLIRRGKLSPEVAYDGYLAHWDALGSTKKKTRSIANRLLLEKERSRD